jgi:Protein of unknown function (DUF1579)
MNKKTVCVLSLAVAASALTALAADKPAGEPAPPAELKQLSLLTGTWTCKGTDFASPMGPEHATEGVARGAKAVGGHWIHVTYDEKSTHANPTPAHFGMYFGYDAASKKFVEACFDSFGGFCTQFSDGWQSDTFSLEGTQTSGGQKMNVRDVFTRQGANGLGHYSEMQDETGKWMKMDEESCTRPMKKK